MKKERIGNNMIADDSLIANTAAKTIVKKAPAKASLDGMKVG